MLPADQSVCIDKYCSDEVNNNNYYYYYHHYHHHHIIIVVIVIIIKQLLKFISKEPLFAGWIQGKGYFTKYVQKCHRAYVDTLRC